MRSKKRPDKKIVTPEGFVRIWQTAKDLNEVIKQTESDAAAVTARALRFRRQGVPLKVFPRRTSFYKERVARLVELAKSLAPKEVKP